MTETAKLEALKAEALKIADQLDEYADIDEAEGGTVYVIEAERRAAVLLRALSRPAVKGLETRAWEHKLTGIVRQLHDRPSASSLAEGDYEPLVRQSDFEQRILSSLSPPTGGWKPISTADKSIAVDMQLPDVPRMLHSYPIWVRCDGGDPFEASWCQRKADRPDGYWWDWDGEDVADPDEWMPHPLQPLPSPPEAE